MHVASCVFFYGGVEKGERKGEKESNLLTSNGVPPFPLYVYSNHMEAVNSGRLVSCAEFKMVCRVFGMILYSRIVSWMSSAKRVLPTRLTDLRASVLVETLLIRVSS